MTATDAIPAPVPATQNEHPGIGPRELIAAIDAAVRGEANMDLAIYLHVPFCASKCHFCDWVVDIPTKRLRSGPEERRAYVAAVATQVRLYGPQLTHVGYRPKVMYWGGGTPTRLEPDEMRSLGDAIQESFDLTGLEQWSMETTPNELTEEKLEAMVSMGVDRVSVGVQSFNPAQLKRSGRAHTGDDSVAAVERLRRGGIDNFNLDLISGFPGEPLESFRDSLEQTLALDPPHVSIYPYRATPKTVMAMQLAHGVREALSAPRMIEAYEVAMDALSKAGYHEYCHGYWVRHAEHEDLDGNFKYDLAGDKIGFGSGAESIIGHHLLWNRNVRFAEYMNDPRRFSFAERYSLDAPQRLTAPVGGALMTREGVVFERFRRMTGLSFHDARATPYVRRWLEVLADCGARFVETGTSFRMEQEVIHRAYIGHIASTMASGLEPERA